MDSRRSLGTAGERLAEAALAERGLVCVERNARTRWGEIDLVCRDDTGYVFVEVKTRRPTSFVAAAEAADERKLLRLRRLGLAWLAAHAARAASWRVALAAVTVGTTATVELFELD